MPQDTTQKTMLAVLIVIGIIILIVLLAPRTTRTQYSYTRNNLAASALQYDPGIVDTSRTTGTFTVVRYIPNKGQSTYSAPQNYTYYTYSTPQIYTDYSYVDQGVVFPDGCTLTSPVSTTTGQPCS